MLIKIQMGSHDAIPQMATGDAVTHVPADRVAANASRWMNREANGRRLRRQRRMERATSQRINGWSVRTW